MSTTEEELRAPFEQASSKQRYNKNPLKLREEIGLQQAQRPLERRSTYRTSKAIRMLPTAPIVEPSKLRANQAKQSRATAERRWDQARAIFSFMNMDNYDQIRKVSRSAYLISAL